MTQLAPLCISNIETGLSSSQARDLILDEAGVATIAGASFGKFGEGYLRSHTQIAKTIYYALLSE